MKRTYIMSITLLALGASALAMDGGMASGSADSFLGSQTEEYTDLERKELEEACRALRQDPDFAPLLTEQKAITQPVFVPSTVPTTDELIAFTEASIAALVEMYHNDSRVPVPVRLISEQDLICKYCNKIASHPYRLTEHIYRMHGEGSKPKLCPICNKQIKAYQYNSHHQKLHSN